MARPHWESIFHFGLQPGVHYLELRPDYSDLKIRMEECEASPLLCQKVAETAQKHFLKWYANPANEIRIRRQMLQIILDRQLRKNL